MSSTIDENDVLSTDDTPQTQGALSVEEAADAFLNRWNDDAEELSETTDEQAQDDQPDVTEDDQPEEDEEEYDTEEEVEEDPSEEDEDAEYEEDDDEVEEEETEADEEAEVAPDDMVVEIQIGEEVKAVSVSDLKRLYGQEASLTRKSQQVADQRKEAETSAQKYAASLEVLIGKAEEQWKPYAEVDMLMASKTMDANEFAQLRKEAQAAYENYKFLTEEADKFTEDIQNRQKEAQAEAAKEAVKVLQDRIPDWSNRLYDDIRSYAIAQGMDAETVNNITDPSAIDLINKARLYDNGKKVATKKVKRKAKRVVRSRKSPNIKADTKAKRDREMVAKLQSGDVDDVTAAIMSRWSE